MNTDVVYFNESLLVLPVANEEEYITNQSVINNKKISDLEPEKVKSSSDD